MKKELNRHLGYKFLFWGKHALKNCLKQDSAKFPTTSSAKIGPFCVSRLALKKDQIFHFGLPAYTFFQAKFIPEKEFVT